MPVFPATGYPGTAAALPVPSVTTLSSMAVRADAVSGERIRRPGSAERALRETVPSSPTRPATIQGRRRIPPLATAATAVTDWSGVTPTSWPMAREAWERPDQFLGGRRIPPVSPGRSIPVGWPNPKSVRCRWKAEEDIMSASLMAPTLLDFSTICCTVR